MRAAVAAALTLLALAPGAAAAPLHWSFEGGDLDGWTARPGSVLGAPVDDRAFFHLHRATPVNREGRFNVSTFEGPGISAVYDSLLGDNLRGLDVKHLLGPGPSPYQGTIESPRFVLTHPIVSMLVAGGRDDDAYVSAHLADGTEIGRTNGGASEWLGYRQLDLGHWTGRSVFLRVVDRGIGPWDYIALDDVRANAPAMPRGLRGARRAKGVTVAWRRVDEPGVSGYRVERADRREGPYRVLATRIGANRLVDRRPPRGDAWYRVSAVTKDGEASEANATFVRRALHLRDRGSTVTYSGNRLGGIAFPVGAIGSGGVVLFGDGTRNQSWIFNIDGGSTSNYPGRRSGMVPNSFLAVRAQAPGRAPVVRALQTRAEGPFEPMGSLTFQGEYPIARYRFSDPALPVYVRERVESPTIPGDLASSSIPTAITTIEVHNPTRSHVRVSLLATQQNAVGLDGRSEVGGPRRRTSLSYGDNVNAVTTDGAGAHLRMRGCSAGRILPTLLRCNGSLALSVLAPGATGTAAWGTREQLLADFAADGAIAGPTRAASPGPATTVDGALTTSVDLGPGERASIPVTFSWYIPTSAVREFGGSGEHYATRWRDAVAVDSEVARRLPELQSRTRRFHDAMYDSNLPQYVLDRLTSQIAVLRSPTVFWAENGFFGGWEGFGCCTGMPNHVWHYAQTAPRLWPEIDRKWESQWLDYELGDGTLPYRYTVPTFAMDGQAGVILGAYRHYLGSGDETWLRRYWPRIARAMDYVVSHHDPDGNGLLAGAQPTTLDTAETGTGSWLGTLYLAALNASRRMATVTGDAGAAGRYGRIYETGRRRQDAYLWNGSYYSEKPEAPQGDSVAYGDGAEADMLLGQWWSSMLGLGDVYDARRMRRALAALYRSNFRENFLGDSPYGAQFDWRAYVEPTEAGLQLLSWPRGAPPENRPRYWDEVWGSLEYAAAATMIQSGLVDKGLRLVRAVADRYDGRMRRALFLGNCGTGDGGGNPFGEGECGQWYARGMSSWSLLLALQGFTYDAAAGSIGFAPRWRPGDHRSFFSAGNAWGTFAQTRSGTTQRDALRVRSGRLQLRRVVLAVPRGGGQRVSATIGRKRLAVTATRRGGQLIVAARSPATLRPGDLLTITSH